jgi:hypothetical protein
MTKGPITPTPAPRPALPADPIVDDTPTDDPCALPVAVSFQGASVALGTAVVAIPEGGRVAILAGSERIGWLPDEAGAVIRACVSRGWAYAGDVTSVSGDTIVAALNGVRLQ